MWVIGTILVILSLFFILLGLVVAVNQLLHQNFSAYWERYFLLAGIGIILYGVSQYF